MTINQNISQSEQQMQATDRQEKEFKMGIHLF